MKTGNIVEITNANNETTTFIYDELDQLTTINYYDASQVSFTYDDAGNRLSMTDGTGTTSYAYDDLYRPLTINAANGNISYTYDAVNRLTVTTSSGTIIYQYTPGNALSSVTDYASGITNYVYDEAGRLNTVTFPNGVAATNTYDIADRLIGISHSLNEVTLGSFFYTLDNAGNRLSMTDNDGSTTYTYDALDRLLSVSYPAVSPLSVSYTYDPMEID